MSAIEASYFENGLTEILGSRYDADIVHQIAHNRRSVALPDEDGQNISYIRVNQGAGERPIVHVPGFSGDIISRAAYAAELATLGADIIIPGQNRARIPGGFYSRFNHATMTQARNYIAVLDKEQVGGDVDIDAQSYGGLCFEGMIRLAEDRFCESHVIFRTVAGMIPNESRLKLVRRTRASIQQEKNSHKDFPQLGEYARKSTKATWSSNLPRTSQECLVELPRIRLNYRRIIPLVASVAFMTNAEDELFPERLQEAAIMDAVSLGASWCSPTQLERLDGSSRSYGGEDATHNDEACNPSRVARAVMSIFENQRVLAADLRAARGSRGGALL